MDTRTILIVAGIVLAVVGVWLLLSYTPGDTFLNPFSGQRESVALPEDWQIRLGRDSARDVERELGGQLHNPELQSRVRQIGRDLVGALRRWERQYQDPRWNAFPFRFQIVASDQVNALALPGGPIYITRGLLAKLQRNEEIAGVLGHELGHVVLRHGAEKLAANLKTSAALWGVKRIFGQEPAEWAGGAAALLNLKYSRDQEREADRFGYQLACLSNYDPQGLIGVLRVLRSMQSGQGTLEIFQTHPHPGNRIQALRTERCNF
ncbi:MAG: M48 family metalloprotease [Salinibacter sp.]